MAKDRVARIGLGTVQLGMDYGIANVTGCPSESMAREILNTAADAGVAYLDTAFGYGRSEAIVGDLRPHGWQPRIVTKTPAFPDAELTPAHGEQLSECLDRSLQRLGTPSVYGLLIHHGADLLKPGGQYLIDALQNAKKSGRAEKIGYSAYTPDEIAAINGLLPADIVQLPLNILDQRALQCGTLDTLDAQGTEIHVRSAFLQGLLLMEPQCLPRHFDSIRSHVRELQIWLQDKGASMLEACLTFVLNQANVSAVIVGGETPEQLSEVIAAARQEHCRHLDFSIWAIDDEKVLNPSNWPA